MTMETQSFEPLSDLVDRWSNDAEAPGPRDYLFRRLLGAICDQQFFPNGLAIQAHRLLLNLYGADGEYRPNQSGVRIAENGKLELTPPERLPEFEPVRNAIDLHSYFHPVLDHQADLASSIVEDVDLFFEWLKNSIPEKRPSNVTLVLNHLAIDRSSFRRWCEGQGWGEPGFIAARSELEATSCGHHPEPQPRSDVPTPSAFQATYWNRTQTVGWIYFRTREIVDEAGRPGASPSQMLLLVHAEDCTPVMPSLGEANEALYEALRSEAITAIGIFDNESEPRPMPATFWAHGKIYEDPEIAATTALAPWNKSWSGLRFPRQQVLQVWPDPSSTPPARTGSVRLSFEQLAGRWLAENQGAGIKEESLAVDLVRLAEGGAFLLLPQEGEPRGSHFDPRLGKYITTFDQHGRPTEPVDLHNYAMAGKQGAEWSRRLTTARDIQVELLAVGQWLDSGEGRAWSTARGLARPWFIPAPPSAPVVSKANAELACTRWLTGMMRAGDATQTKTEFQRQALAKFEISQAGFRRCWSSAIQNSGNPNWSRSGPKKRKNADKTDR